MNYQNAKRAMDAVGACLLLLLLAPLLAIIAVAVRLDGGPALFRQQRVGRNGQTFSIVKFRTMVVHADELLDDKGRPTGNRITALGKWLRKSSLDELPQLWNILTGDMSFIGPRPILTSWDHKFQGERRVRFHVRPGITGLAQVKGRNTLRWSRRAELDREYVQNLSFARDVSILVATVGILFRPENVVLDRNTADVDDLL